VIFTIDTLRADHLSSYGYFQNTTPNIDSLAQEGITFTKAFCQVPHTPPSHWSMFTGLYPYKHGKFGPFDDGSGIITLSDILKESGYVTSGFISHYILRGFNKEFDYFNGYDQDNPEALNKREQSLFHERKAGETTASVLSWLENHSSERFFLWVHYFDPHFPYGPPEEFDVYNYADEQYYSDKRYDASGGSRRRDVRAAPGHSRRRSITIRDDIAKYDGEIRYVDENIGVVLKKLKDLDLESNTLVVILSDHGECFGEHNWPDFGYQEEGPCLGHGRTLYDVETHIPLIIKNPKFSTTGIRTDQIVETVDLLPTVLDILGIHKNLVMDGESLLPLVEKRTIQKTQAIAQLHRFSKSVKPFGVGIRTNEWKFVNMIFPQLNLEGVITEGQGNEEQAQERAEEITIKKMLFRVGEGETVNYHKTESAIAEELEGKLKGIISTDRLPETTELDKKTEELLKSLGYL
jgi:arylsulfatase A-like enzyme